MILFLVLIFAIFPNISAQECEIDVGYIPMLLNDDWPVDTIVSEDPIPRIEGSISNAFFDKLANNFTTDLATIFKINSIEVDPGFTQIEIFPGEKFWDFVDIDPRIKNPRDISLKYTCGGKEISKDVRWSWTDINTRPPTFESSSEEITINTKWQNIVPINWNIAIEISDLDHSLENTKNIQLSTAENIFRFEISPRDEVEPSPVPEKYFSDLRIYIQDNYQLQAGTFPIVITASDGQNDEQTMTINLIVEASDEIVPEFEETHYLVELKDWPKENEEVGVNIKAIVPGDDSVVFEYEIGNPTEIDFLTFTSGSNALRFTREITPVDGFSVAVAIVKATVDGTTLSVEAPLVIKFPDLVKVSPVLTSTFHPFQADWEANQEFTVDNFLSNFDGSERLDFSKGAVHPSGVFDIDIQNGDVENSVKIVVRDISEGVEFSNNVLLVEVKLRVEDDPDREVSATIALYFPEKEVPTTVPPTDCPIITDEPCDCSSSTTEGTTDCPTDPTCPPPVTCPIDPTCPPPVTDPTCPTCPTESTCPPPVTCPTDPSCPTSGTESTCPPPVTCPTDPSCPTTVTCSPEDCPTSSSGMTCPPPVTDPTCPTCPTESTFPPPVTCPTDPSCPTSGTESTCPPPVTCPTDPSCPTTVTCSPEDCTTSESCPPCITTEFPTTCPETDPTPSPCPSDQPGTGSTDCPVTCPEPITCPTTETPFTCPDPVTGPTTCPEPITCSSDPTASSTGTSSSPCPTTPAPTPCPITCATTAEPVTFPEATTTTKKPQECASESSSSNSGLIAAVGVVSAIAVGGLGIAAYLFWKLKNVSTFTSMNGGSTFPKSAKVSFAEPSNMSRRGTYFGNNDDKGLTNSGFSNEPALNEVVTHPEPSTSTAAAAASPYASAPIVDSSTPIKSSLAKPKEIPPDYEEGRKAFPPEGDSSKPKSTGVKIAPDVEYIPDGDVDVEGGEHL